MGTVWLWVGFNLFVLLMLALDLGVFHRRAHAISLREAGAWSVVWVVISLAFNLGLLHWYGKGPALEFFTGYLIEKSLSVDNIFVFVLLFRYFAVEPRHQHRVLYWGILGALVMRGMMIGVGVALIRRFEWILYLFGAFLIFAGAKMMFQKVQQVHPEGNPVLRWARKVLPLTESREGQQLFVRQGGIWRATPLFLVLLVVETTDLLFALDSIPAIFAITRDPFIVYTSNVFAILGLRAFYFLLAGVLPYFRYLGAGLSLVLMFIGAKMLAEHWLVVPTHVSLLVVGVILAVAVLASVVAAKAEAREPRGQKAPLATRKRQVTAGNQPHLAEAIRMLAATIEGTRKQGANTLWKAGREMAGPVLRQWLTNQELRGILAGIGPSRSGYPGRLRPPKITVGVAVTPENFENIHRANASPRLASVPPDQDAREFELRFDDRIALDILTTNSPAGNGAIARFLQKFGEGIQQVECETRAVGRATHLLWEKFGVKPLYPATRRGADGTRVNFFLVERPDGRKILIELVEEPENPSPST